MNREIESDAHMLKRVSLQFAILFFLLFISDTIIDSVLGLIDLFLELLHLIFEFFEYTIEILIEEALHTSHLESQLILVYGGAIVGLYGFFRIIKATPQYFHHVKRNLLTKWMKFKQHKASYWHLLSLIQKTKLVSAYCFGTFCLLFLVML